MGGEGTRRTSRSQGEDGQPQSRRSVEADWATKTEERRRRRKRRWSETFQRGTKMARLLK